MSTIAINKDWCKMCGICIALCPKNVFEASGEGYPIPRRQEECVGCRLCELRCPDFALKVEEG